jgi:hypothetical protein
MPAVQSVTVYCSSSSRVPRVYFEAARHLGAAIAHQRWTLVYGGNAVGLMGEVADAVRDGGGRVVGITPQVLVDKGITDRKCHELIVTPDMRQRKALLESRGDAFIALPGGLGTFEEIFEIIVGRQLNVHHKPVILLNVAGYYGPLLAMVDHGVEQGFIKPEGRRLFHVAATVEEAVEQLRAVGRDEPPPPTSVQAVAEGS